MRIKQNIGAKIAVLLATVAAFTGTWTLVRDIASSEPAAATGAPASPPVQRYYDDDDGEYEDDDDDDDRGAFQAPAGATLRVPRARTHAS